MSLSPTRLPRLLICLLSLASLNHLPGLAARSAGASLAETQRRYQLDPSRPVADRVGETPESVMTLFDEPGQATPTPHALSAEERARFAAALDALPALLRGTLSQRLRRVSFLDGMPNTALTSTVNPGEAERLYDLTIRAGTLHEDAGAWLTWKERTLFDAKDSRLTVSVEAGPLDAIVFVLLHEATHMVDNAEGITPPWMPPGGRGAGPTPTVFTRAAWTDRTVIAPRYRAPLLDAVVFRANGRVLPIADAPALYEALGKTPFASVYASTSWYDDLAELVAVHHWTAVLRQPYRIVVRDGDRTVSSYEPMRSELVRGRLDQLQRFYADGR